MGRSNNRIRKWGTFTVVGILAVWCCYQTTYGRVSAHVPWVWGFSEYETRNALLYANDNAPSDEWSQLDDMVGRVADFHGMPFHRKPEFVLCDSMSQYSRITGTVARFVTMPVSGRIYVSPKARRELKNGEIQFDTYIRHELSHALLYQNMTVLQSLSYPGWFMEGLAMVAAEQMGTDGYYSRAQTINALNRGVWVAPGDWGTIVSSKGDTVKSCPIEDKFHFIYSEYALIITELIATHGLEKLKRFIRLSPKAESFNHFFREFFGVSPSKVISKYRTPG